MKFVQFFLFEGGAPIFLRADSVLMLTTCNDRSGAPLVGATGVVGAAGPTVVRGTIESVAAALGIVLVKTADPASGMHTLKLPREGA